MSDRIILKLGGSVITDKGADCTVNKSALAGIASAIAGAPPATQIVVVHGAGSCGHPEARKYQLDRGATAGHTEGIGITHDAVSSLNTAVVAALRDAGVQAVGIHPLHAGVADQGRLVAFETGHMEKMLALGMVPVIHGDVVMDLSRGACIVSGDQLVRHLAVALKCTRVGLATDVPGVLDGGRVVREITPRTVHTLQIGSSSHTDVTGGMKGKIDELLGLAAAGTESGIFSVSRLGDFLAGKDHGGTTVRGG
ncbi:isopentenyl phosphate kinase [Methanoregula sp.]|uniref:isopentenyl phosphate kinase n=1 Tax=Methanoregula sp. TaxID=2052170 RepID=UPI002CC62770|nr:isopentenyl phosphate kinase [Methanoregula sp.]HVP97509.1 isopentenyl phosphate kinase [Methanoregula sp.]